LREKTISKRFYDVKFFQQVGKVNWQNSIVSNKLIIRIKIQSKVNFQCRVSRELVTATSLIAKW
jgi:hypothetical protein